MNIKRAIAGVLMAALFAGAVPAMPALADGAASTRNIIFGLGAASYLIIQHNRKVHEKYAEDARRQAALESQNRDAWAAYSSEKNAYANASAEISDLKREVAYQHQVIEQQRTQLALAQHSGYQVHAVYAPARRSRASKARRVAWRPHPRSAPANQVASVSYGWGTL